MRWIALLIALAGCQRGAARFESEARYRVDHLILPSLVTDFAVDLNGDGTPDNQLSGIVGALSAFWNVQSAVEAAFSSGREQLEIDVRTRNDGSAAAILFDPAGGQVALFEGTTDGMRFKSPKLDAHSSPVEFSLKLAFIDDLP